MSTLLLPNLQEDHRIAITRRGEWVSDSGTNLSNLANDIKVMAGTNSDITSIPDLWARLSMYEIVLFDEQHYLHDKFLAEWRGMLAVLALREMRAIGDIEAQSIEILTDSVFTDNDPRFLRVITKSLPEEYKQFPDPTIDNGYKLHIISYKEHPFAVVWPTILACPAVELESDLLRPVTWWQTDGCHDCLVDPVSSLNEQEKAVLNDWLEMVKAAINGMAFVNPKISRLMGLLGRFQEDLHITEAPTFTLVAGTALGITGFCACLGQAKMINVDAISFLSKSNVMLVDIRHKGACLNKPKTLLVITRDICQQWNKSASEIIVGGAYSYDAVEPKFTGVIIDNTKIGKIDLTKYNTELRMGEDFFTEKICAVLSDVDEFPNAQRNFVMDYNGNVFNILLPVKEELLNYLDEEYLALNSKIETNGTDIVVEITLPLTGFNGKGEKIVIKKIYGQSDILIVGALPVIQVWPNFIMDEKDDSKTANWQAYYSFYNNIRWTNNQDESKQLLYARPYWDKEGIVERKLQVGERKAEILKSDSFPTAYICNVEKDQGTYNETVSEPVGVILLKKPQTVQYNMASKKAKIGIDFGTTNTVAYMSIDGNPPDIVTLHNYNKNDPNQSMLYDVTLNSDELKQQECRRNFIAMSEQPQKPATSIRTILHTHGGNFTGNLGIAPLLRGNIYYLDDAKNIIEDENISGSLHTDEMKWDVNGVYNMQSFLQELGMQCMAEAVKEGVTQIEWAYSYPTSFTLAQISSLSGIWNNNMNMFKSISALVTGTLNSRTESIAMATFFANQMNAHIVRGIVCLDIGGGSTDIAVWQGYSMSKDDVRYQTSLRFAGKEILIRQLFKNKEVLNDLVTNDSLVNDQIKEVFEKNKEKEFDLMLEAVLKYNEDIIFSALPALSQQDSIKTLRRNIVFALSGIFFYTGIVIAYLRVNDNYEEYEFLPNCYVGGNGSTLLNWPAAGIYNSADPINYIFEECLIYGVEIGQTMEKAKCNSLGEPFDEEKLNNYDHDFTIECTTFPKQEVAYGLVCDRVIKDATGGKTKENQATSSGSKNPLKNSRVKTEKTIVAGEEFELDGTSKSGIEGIKPDYIIRGMQVNRKLDVFHKFRNKFNELAPELDLPEIVLESRDFQNICSAVNTELIEKKKNSGGKANNVETEPLFIMVLRHTLRMI